MQLLFAGQTPRLKKLELRGTRWLAANQFDSLTHLQIQGADANDWDFMPELFVVLSHCPVLQELFLSMFRQEDPPVSALPIVTLCHLRRLAIGDPYEGDLINMFLSHVSLPEDGVAIRLFDFYHDYGNDNEWVEECPHLSFMDTLTTVRFSTMKGAEVIMTGPSSGLRLENPVLSPGELLHILRPHEQSCPLTELWLDDRWHMLDDDSLCELLAHMPSLSTIVVIEGASSVWFSTVIDALCRQLGAASTLLCQHLTTLHLWLCRSALPIAIVDLLDIRVVHGYPLERLII
ncbi:hypothetical protein B0H21DRAFT_707496 [Amylocystis lapponica]|nr:hypothetical protein B0H21DRAFT_707496 [Amylocystis lapponica]